MNICWFTN